MKLLIYYFFLYLFVVTTISLLSLDNIFFIYLFGFVFLILMNIDTFYRYYKDGKMEFYMEKIYNFFQHSSISFAILVTWIILALFIEIWYIINKNENINFIFILLISFFSGLVIYLFHKYIINKK